MPYNNQAQSNYYLRRSNHQNSHHAGNSAGSNSYGSRSFHNGTHTDQNMSNDAGVQLYMGDLEPSWDENVIKRIWSSIGEDNISVKMMWQNNNYMGNESGPRNQGYCFIDFPTHFNASNALLKNKMSIPGHPHKKLKLNWASSSAPSTAGVSTTGGNNFSIFVGDLAPNVTEAQLFDLFISRYPSTEHAKVVIDLSTGVSKGYGFIRFRDPADQQTALAEMQGVFLNGRALKVGMSSGQSNSGAGGSRQVGHDRYGGSKPAGGKSNTPNSALFSQFMYPIQQQPALNHFTDPNNTTVFIGGLSPLVKEEELRQYFQPFGEIVYVKIPVGKGCGFVQYIDRISAETAISQMQGFPISNSRVRLSWGRSAKQQQLQQHGSSPCTERSRYYSNPRTAISLQ
ncbi:Nam8p KNAG_0B04440 [Huiozyma naganishii CBS 8797]|uniref:RRM domain-containing protein n=1 Tax=Huiozyma naganishii (strain ATCC MYA-139 / BCRC 22969 / CBS 8797 / KCTC 17520 / NBRC 10181 / NCYC 3082 / Yp74L-3) TaxID=1071383 RepID=J7RH63_HUIN7|nr:hypothetical protein KNAG_0B04440 [Kazachstania naganishii CBS 8797]CCK68878.1 hypothetical protein KNAG_0B04440 [Kazachstania naganishii CBS 8797]